MFGCPYGCSDVPRCLYGRHDVQIGCPKWSGGGLGNAYPTTDGHRTDDDDGADDGTDGRTEDEDSDNGTRRDGRTEDGRRRRRRDERRDGRTEDDNGDDGTDTTGPTDDICSSEVSNTTLGRRL